VLTGEAMAKIARCVFWGHPRRKQCDEWAMTFVASKLGTLWPLCPACFVWSRRAAAVLIRQGLLDSQATIVPITEASRTEWLAQNGRANSVVAAMEEFLATGAMVQPKTLPMRSKTAWERMTDAE